MWLYIAETKCPHFNIIEAKSFHIRLENHLILTLYLLGMTTFSSKNTFGFKLLP